MIPQFALQLIFGMALTWCLAPRKHITSGFFRIQNLVTLGLSVLSLLTLTQLQSFSELSALHLWMLRGTILLLAGTSFVGSVLWTLERRIGGTRCAFLILGVAAVAVVSIVTTHSAANSSERIHQVGTALSAGWLVGGTTSAMLLGHWYLTASGMPLDPLIRMNQWFAVAAAVRSLFAVWSGAVAHWGGLDAVAISWVVLRWFGLLGPIAIAYLVVQILKYRNTQSATGVLYAATIGVFMGEMAASLLASSEAFSLWP
ncbi:MAG: hypothetical protein KDA88_08320 [Planctomycetaceae bacterium]|nr:hypothetical protein [Planctomycetaceae bacterium]MCB9951304.1 hypothetical protein [Planctomycetaceae bacterium]